MPRPVDERQANIQKIIDEAKRRRRTNFTIDYLRPIAQNLFQGYYKPETWKLYAEDALALLNREREADKQKEETNATA